MILYEDEWLPLEIHPETPKEGMTVARMFPGTSAKKMYASLRNQGCHTVLILGEMIYYPNYLKY